MRKRYFVIGKLNEHDDFLLDELINNLSKERMTLAKYLGDNNININTEFYYMIPRNFQRRAIFSIYEPSTTIRGVNRPIPPSYKFHHADKTTDITKVRTLTTKERSYIQTFPDNFIFIGTKTNQEQTIGNAVPVKMAEYIATIINKHNNK